MSEFFRICRELTRSSWFYFYWAISAAGIITSHLNQGIHGSAYLGGASILCTLAGILVFYRQLKLLREHENLPGRIGEFQLILAIYAFRIRLLLLFAPFLALFFYTGGFDFLAKNYIGLITAPVDRRWIEAKALLSYLWPWLLLLFTFSVCEQGGRTFVVAQGHSGNGIRRIPLSLSALKGPMALFVLAELILMAAGMTDLFNDPLTARGDWSSPVLKILLTPLSFSLQIGATVFMAGLLKKKKII